GARRRPTSPHQRRRLRAKRRSHWDARGDRFSSTGAGGRRVFRRRAVPACGRRVILDLHTHSIRSDDGRAKVESYCQWVRRKELPLDGFVLTEHRQFDLVSDYRALEDEFGLLILKASEVETDYGH